MHKARYLVIGIFFIFIFIYYFYFIPPLDISDNINNSSNIGGSCVKDNYCHAKINHWPRLPITYNYNEACLRIWEGDYLEKINKAINYIEEATNGVVYFERANSPTTDLFFICELGKEVLEIRGFMYYVTLAESFPYVYEGTNVYANSAIYLYSTSTGGCETPVTLIHEILHSLGIGHSENPNSIMYAYANGCFPEMEESIINTLIYTYGKKSEDCGGCYKKNEENVFNISDFLKKDLVWNKLPVAYSTFNCSKNIVDIFQRGVDLLEFNIGTDLITLREETPSEVNIYCNEKKMDFIWNISMNEKDNVDVLFSRVVAKQEYFFRNGNLSKIDIDVYPYWTLIDSDEVFCGAIEMHQLLHGLGLRNHYGVWMNKNIKLCENQNSHVLSPFAIKVVRELYGLNV